MIHQWLKTFGLAGGESAQDRIARRAESASEKQFHAVSVSLGANCCDAIKQFTDTRFLTTEAPKLPLEACDKTQCSCRFRRHADRRRESRRLADSGVFTMPVAFKGDEQRAGRGRRKSDDKLTD